MTEWVQTLSGKAFHLDPQRDADDDQIITIEDIAGHLAKICRFNGACTEFYSVAQHSVLVAIAMPERLGKQARLFALLHDASEAYIADVTRPVKHRIGPEYAQLERAIQRRIHLALGLPPSPGPFTKAAIKDLDDRLLATERQVLMKPSTKPWQLDAQPLGIEIKPWDWRYAEQVFLRLFYHLHRV
jgi:hypothetical protein